MFAHINVKESCELSSLKQIKSIKELKNCLPKDQETEAIKLDQVTLKKLNSIQEKLISEMFKMNYNRNLLTEEQIEKVEKLLNDYLDIFTSNNPTTTTQVQHKIDTQGYAPINQPVFSK